MSFLRRGGGGRGGGLSYLWDKTCFERAVTL